MMLPSRSVRKRLPRPRAPPGARRSAGPGGAVLSGASGVTAMAIPAELSDPCLGLLDPDARARALVAALGAHVGTDRGLVQELQAGVDVGHAGQALGDLVHVELEDGQEALEVGLL